MPAKGTKKNAPTKPVKSTAKKTTPRKNPNPPEIWACIVKGWVRYRGTRYEKGDTILVQPGKMTEADLNTLQKYFEPKPTGVMAGVSEPIELLDEGENHGSDSN